MLSDSDLDAVYARVLVVQRTAALPLGFRWLLYEQLAPLEVSDGGFLST